MYTFPWQQPSSEDVLPDLQKNQGNKTHFNENKWFASANLNLCMNEDVEEGLIKSISVELYFCYCWRLKATVKSCFSIKARIRLSMAWKETLTHKFIFNY